MLLWRLRRRGRCIGLSDLLLLQLLTDEAMDHVEFTDDVGEGGRTVFSALNADPAFYGQLAAMEPLRGRPPLTLPPCDDLSPAHAAQRETGKLSVEPRLGMRAGDRLALAAAAKVETPGATVP